MNIDVTVTIGGAAGQGIQTVGDLLAGVCHRAGLYLMVINDFESRIRGGHSFMQLRICDEPVTAPDDRNHLLVALNRESLDRHADQLFQGGRILKEVESNVGAGEEGNVVDVGFTKLAEDAGGKIMINTVAAGAALGMLGAPAALVDQVIEEAFGGKSQSVVENNKKAAKSGFDAVADIPFDWKFDWPARGPQGKMLSGAQALALGALAADCRVAAFYPMSPATGILVHMAQFMDRFPLVVEQAEDEIAAINIAIGASFAGVRALTGTSGGGFSLMVEGIGLAGITETPLVVINAQRPGPATGLPTRTGQGDLHFVIHAAPDEFPRFVFAPRTLDEAFETVIRSFHLAEKYQVPAIVLVDQYFTDSLSIASEQWRIPESIERFLVSDADMEDPAGYKRFAITDSGVSPRAVPCAGKARVMVTGNEHREDGHLSETISDRNGQVDKRSRKMLHMAEEMRGPEAIFPDARLLLVTWGSTDGVVREAVNRLRSENYDVGAVFFSDIWPFPASQAAAALSGCGHFITVELNTSSQLGGLIRRHTGLDAASAIVQYDGRPMRRHSVVTKTKQFMEGANG
ncbi:MAG: 2-oxoacid:acceptor oxidoreductase subunit alpha [Desulfosalsimonadaceae bacterium]